MNANESQGHVFEKALHFYQSDRYDLAEVELRGLLQDQPNDVHALCLLAECHLQRGNPSQALKVIEHALALAPQWSHVHLVHGQVCNALRDRPGAEKAYLEALRGDPMNAYAYGAYADLMYDSGHFDKALALADRALAIDPESATVLMLRGRILDSKGKKRDSRRAIDTAIQHEPDELHSVIMSGVRLYEQGHPFQARKQLVEALRRDPTNADLRDLTLEVDRWCRPPGIAAYFFGVYIGRVPAGWLLVWAIWVISIRMFPEEAQNSVLFQIWFYGYLVFVVYTWFAAWLCKLWVKAFPPAFESR